MRVLPAALLALVALAALPAAHAALGMPEPLTERGEVVVEIYNIVAVLGIVVFVIVFVWLVLVIVRFRETTGHGRSTHERERHSLGAELAWFLVPLALVLYIGVIAYAGLLKLDHGVDPDDVPPENRILIEASQWNWRATYPGNFSVSADPDGNSGAVSDANVFYVPAGKPILFNVTATDVIHAFDVRDANNAYVAFIDANPLGMNKYNFQVATFPEGDYHIQCNKMCLNPGHAYMRGRIKAVAEDAYQLWASERAAIGRSPVFQSIALKVEGGRLVDLDGSEAGPFRVVSSGSGTRVVLNVTAPSQDVVLTAPDGSTKTIRAGERRDPFFGFTVATSGNATVRAEVGGTTQEIAIEGIEAEVLRVDMGDFRFIPQSLEFEGGRTYLLTLRNVHNLPHNLFIGHYNGGTNPEVLAASETLPGGASSSMVFEAPAEGGAFDIWCNVPGHAPAGMLHEDSASVA